MMMTYEVNCENTVQGYIYLLNIYTCIYTYLCTPHSGGSRQGLHNL